MPSLEMYEEDLGLPQSLGSSLLAGDLALDFTETQRAPSIIAESPISMVRADPTDIANDYNRNQNSLLMARVYLQLLPMPMQLSASLSSSGYPTGSASAVMKTPGRHSASSCHSASAHTTCKGASRSGSSRSCNNITAPSATDTTGFSPSMFLRSSPFRLPTFTTQSEHLLNGQQSSPRPVRAR